MTVTNCHQLCHHLSPLVTTSDRQSVTKCHHHPLRVVTLVTLCPLVTTRGDE